MAFPYLAVAQLGLGAAQSLFGNKGGGGKGGGGMPTFDPQQALDFGSQAFNQAAQEGIQFSRKGTRANISNQEAVTPGSQAQRQAALNQINQYIQGQVPLDVQQNTQRAIAQSFGGGYNAFTGGGQAPSAFARNIGQTSVGLSQFGLSAAPTWQQLANSMVVSPSVGLQGGLQAIGLGKDLAESQYQSQANQYGAQQAQQQYGNTMLNQGLGNFANIMGSQDKSGYLSTISKFGGFGGLPAATGYSAYAQPGGSYYQPGTSVMVPTFGGK
jgi:hypothetical protein